MDETFHRFDEISEKLSIHFQQRVNWLENIVALVTLPKYKNVYHISQVLDAEEILRCLFKKCNELSSVNYKRKDGIGDSIIEDLVYDNARFSGRPLNILLITGDADFVELVEALKVKDINVYLGKPRNCAKKLQEAMKQDQQFEL